MSLSLTGPSPGYSYISIKYLLSLWISLAFLGSSAAQDPIFSQFHFSSVYLNPAYTGIDGGFTATAVNREQWGRVSQVSPLPGAFATRFASVEMALDANLTNAISGIFMSDQEGDGNLRTTYAGLNYCYVLPWEGKYKQSLNNLRLAFGMYYAQKRIEWDQLLFSDQLDAKGPDYFSEYSSHQAFFEDFEDSPPWWVGLNFGLLYRFTEKDSHGDLRQLSLGLSGTHLLNLINPASVESLQGIGTGQAPRLTLSGQYFDPALQFGNKKNRFTFIPAVRMEYQSGKKNYFSGGINAITAGAHLYFKNIGLGTYYHRTSASTIAQSTDALILMWDTEFPFGEDQSLEVGLSYDINISGLSGLSGGVFEVGVKYRWNTYASSIICPRVSRAHQERWENAFYRNGKNKNLD